METGNIVPRAGFRTHTSCHFETSTLTITPYMHADAITLSTPISLYLSKWGRVTAITFIYAEIHFTDAYNLQHHQRPVPLVPSLYGVGG